MKKNNCLIQEKSVFFKAFEEKMRSLQQKTFDPQPANGIVLIPVTVMLMLKYATVLVIVMISEGY